jgi:hypothetical protein
MPSPQLRGMGSAEGPSRLSNAVKTAFKLKRCPSASPCTLLDGPRGVKTDSTRIWGGAATEPPSLSG